MKQRFKWGSKLQIPFSQGVYSMGKIVSVKCAACGAVLNIQENTKVFKCEYCGSEHLAAADEGDIADQLEKISPSLDRAASEMAIKRLKEELAELDKQTQIRLKDIEAKKRPGSA